MAIIFNKELRSRNKDNEKMILNGFANQRIGEKDFDYEQRRLHFVYDLAKSYIKELSSNIPNPNVIESSTFTSYEDAFDLMNAKKMNSRQNTRIREVENSLEELYFGKIIISEEEKDDNNELYIGKNIQRIKGSQYAVDWRAPISSLYYNKTQLVFTSLNQKNGELREDKRLA
jgi:DNA helicase IV